MPLSGVAPLARFLVQQARDDLPRLILVHIKYRLNLDPVGRKPAFDVVDVFGPERIEKTAPIDSIGGFGGENFPPLLMAKSGLDAPLPHASPGDPAGNEGLMKIDCWLLHRRRTFSIYAAT